MGRKRNDGEQSDRLPRTLCWRCRRSFLNGCSWAEKFEPVKGWNAIQRTISISWGTEDRQVETYTVIGCPLFKDDSPNGDIANRVYRAKRIEDSKGAEELAAAIVKMAIEDYIDYYKLFLKLRDKASLASAKHIEDWIRSKDFAAISKIDPDWLISKMKQKSTPDRPEESEG